MFDSRQARITRCAVAALGLAMFLGGTAFAQGPAVNMRSQKIETAKQKNALKAYRMKGGYKGDAAARALADKLFKAAKLNDSAALVDDKSNHMIYVSKKDPSAHFRIDKMTGDLSFNKGLQQYLGDGAITGLPTKDQAAELAKRHLTNLGLMPEKQGEMVVRHIGGLKQVDVTADGKATERDRLVTVHFGRQIDGIDVGGPGSKIVVDLGANGELVGLTRRWMEATEEKKNDADFKPQADVINAIKGKLRRDGANAKRIDSSSPDFGYFDDGKGNIEPAYFYTADVTYDLQSERGGRKEHKEKHHGAISALRSSKADFEQLEKAKKPPEKSAAVTKDKPPVKD